MRAVHAAAFAAVFASLALVQTAHADDEATASRASMEQYSRGERGESFALVAAGAVSWATAAAAYADGGNLPRGVAIPLAVGGLYEIASGVTLYFRTARWEQTAQGSLAGDAPAFRERELSRLEAARRRLGVAEVVETALFATGGFLAFFTSGSGNEMLRGVGIGSAVEGATLLTFDAFAALRGDRYSTALRDIGLRVTPERSGAVVSVQRSF